MTKLYKLLDILNEHPGLTANQFATKYFSDKEHEYLFTAVSNQGNGACAGKKAWLCAGSILGKQVKAGLVRTGCMHPKAFFLTDKGHKLLNQLKETPQ